jgi:hypothetical protein
MRSHIFFYCLLGLLVVGLTSCSTKYHAMSGGINSGKSGYGETQIDDKTWEVVYRESGNIGADVVDRYALFRAAELTLEKGYTYFVILNTVNDKDTKTVTLFSDPSTNDLHKQTRRSSVKTIRMYKVDPGTEEAIFKAESVVQTMGSAIERE